MEGKGAYNRHAKLQARGASLALPLLQRAVQNLELSSGAQPIVIADYGSSQGKNSLFPLCVAIGELRNRIDRHRPIVVYHIDQPANDFNTLFEVLDSDPQRYVVDEPHVFPCAIGRSFYESVLPPESVDLGWSSYAAVWLSRVPMPIPGHFFPPRSTGAVRDAFERQAAEDWEKFLALRAGELRAGGRLVVVLPARNDDGLTGFENLADCVNAVLGELVEDGALAPEERARMVLGAVTRENRHLLAPFSRDGQFRRLIVEHCELSELPDPAWADYEAHGDKELLAAQQAQFFRATFVPSLTPALSPDRSAQQRQEFVDRFEQGLTRRLASQPAAMNSYVQTMVVAKRGPA